MQSALVRSLARAARAAGLVLRRHFAERHMLLVREKGPADFVSQADLDAESAILAALTEDDASARFQAEETATGQATSGPRYIVDPLDGTTNFLRGVPHFCTSIAYADATGVLAGVVLDPLLDELFWAERDQGAFFGDRRLVLSASPALGTALLHTGNPHLAAPSYATYLAQLERVMAKNSSLRRLGAAALDLAYVAAGRGDAFFEPALKPWDIAAGLLLVREAGGVVTDHRGGDGMLESGDVLAATRELHPELLGLLRGAAEAYVTREGKAPGG